MKKLIPAIKFIVFLSIAVGLMYLALKGTDIRDLVNKFKGAHYGYVFLSLIPAMLAFMSRAWRWKIMLHPLGYKPKFKNTFYALMVGYLANLALPRLGEVSRSVALNRAEKIPLDRILGTVIAERAVDVVSLLICIILALILEFETIYSFIMNALIQPLMAKISRAFDSGLIYMIIAVLILAVVALVILIRKRESETSLMNKINLFLKGIWVGLTSIMKMKNHNAFILHSVFIWVMYWLSPYICFFALDATSFLDMKAAIYVLVIGGIGMSAPVQGGIGAFHLLVISGLSLFKIQEADAKTYAIIIHESQMLVVILVGSISLLMLSLKQKQKTTDVNT